ncbi:MAG: aminotransferase class V-fold PLP-dependent enzyme [Deltaproteobacteria bacterium]|nr:aminotransferase class V-fold PLP-dependent enzyme [Deltaproteobacteria bacterium]
MFYPSVTDRFVEIHPKIRQRFPQLEQDLYGNRRTYLNSGGGTLMVDSAVHALAQTAGSANPQPGDVDPAEIATDQLQWRVRQLVADFINASRPEEISFHFSTTHALFNLAYSLRAILNSENNLVVTDLDHMANISPWEDVWGEERGCEIRRARVDGEGRLDVDSLLSLVDGKTGLVALAMASNGLGSVVPLRDVIPLIREKSPTCLICVDAVHHALHGPVDVREMDCDFLAFSGYKVFGPMLGVLWGRATLLDRLAPYRVETGTDRSPYKFEQGTLNSALLASLEGALGYLLWLGDELAVDAGSENLSRKERFSSVMKAVTEYEGKLSQVVLEGFEALDAERFRCYGVTDPQRVLERDPTFSFEIEGTSPEQIKRYLWEEYGFQIADRNHYSAAVYRHLGRDSICRASFAHYDTLQTARSLVEALEGLLG